MTFDQRGSLELHGRRGPASFQALERAPLAVTTDANTYCVLQSSESETMVRIRKSQIFTLDLSQNKVTLCQSES